jgi:hypothetical protein
LKLINIFPENEPFPPTESKLKEPPLLADDEDDDDDDDKWSAQSATDSR